MLPLKGRRVALRRIEKGDLPILLEWRNEERFRTFCSTRRNEVTLQEFDQELQIDFERDRYLQVIISLGDQPIGTLYAYGLNKTDGYIFITTYLAPDFEKSGYGAEAFILFAHHLFSTLPLYKIYTEAYSYNEYSIKGMKNGGFVEEGCFRGHRLFNGERFDLIRLAFFREQVPKWEPFVQRLIKAQTERG